MSIIHHVRTQNGGSSFQTIKGVFLVILLGAIGAGLLCLTGCRKKTVDYSVTQRAHQNEIEAQNKALLEQFVIAAEEMEKHPEPGYLGNALARLNSWLASSAPSRDFRNREEFEAKRSLFETVAASAETVDAIYRKAVPANNGKEEGISDSEKNAGPDSADGAGTGENPAGELTEAEGEELITALENFSTAAGEVATTYRSDLFALAVRVADEMKEKLTGAKQFQFGDKGKMMKAALAQFQFPPFLNFQLIAEGSKKIANLYQLDAHSFSSEDADYLMGMIWERNVAGWVRGDHHDPVLETMNLFDWVCEAITLHPEPIQAFGIPLVRKPWQTLLTSQGTGMERSIVFMELLRQIGITSFIVRPADLPEEKVDAFPLIVGVVLPIDPASGDATNANPSATGEGDASTSLRREIFLFLPEWGIPVPGEETPVLATEGEGHDKKGLQFPSIATLAEASERDDLLRNLDLPENPFPVTSEDFKRVRALLPMNPFNGSERMWVMMREWVIQRRNDLGESGSAYIPPVLAISYDSVRSELDPFPQIVSVETGWEFQTPTLEQAILPMESDILIAPYLFSVQAGNDLSTTDSDESSQKIAPTEGAGSDQKPVNPKEKRMIFPLWEGKILYFAGNFVSENGAANRLQQGRVSDRVLKQMSHDMGANLNLYMEQVQKTLDQSGASLSDQEMRTLARNFVSQQRQEIGMKVYLKVAARFYLVLISHALGNESAAMDHLKDTALLTQLDGMWKTGALYLLGRIYEEQGDLKQAISIFNHLDGPTGYGTKLRAKWLQEGQQLDSGTTSEEVPEPEGTEITPEGGTSEPEGVEMIPEEGTSEPEGAETTATEE